MSISSLPETPTVTVPTATSTRLYNDDLSPVTNRNWGVYNFYYGILTYLGSTGLQIAALRVAHDAVEPLTHPTYLDSEDARASPNRTVQQAGHQSGGSHDHTVASEPRDARARWAEVG